MKNHRLRLLYRNLEDKSSLLERKNKQNECVLFTVSKKDWATRVQSFFYPINTPEDKSIE